MTLDKVADKEQYWDFSWAEMRYDVYANVDEMYRNAGGQAKGYYFGYSQGNIQMTVALIEGEDKLKDKLARVIHLAPCTVNGS